MEVNVLKKTSWQLIRLAPIPTQTPSRDVSILPVGATNMLCDLCQLIQLRPSYALEYATTRRERIRSRYMTALKRIQCKFGKGSAAYNFRFTEFYYPHHRDLDALRESAERGCQVCRILHAGLSDAKVYDVEGVGSEVMPGGHAQGGRLILGRDRSFMPSHFQLLAAFESRTISLNVEGKNDICLLSISKATL